MSDSAFRKYTATIFYRLGFTANVLTLAGLALAGLTGFYIYIGQFFTAACVLLASGFLDMMDGAVARLSGKAGAFGGILDSTLDRYGDALVLGGLLFFGIRTGRPLLSALAFTALAGSFAISYVRARAECELDVCRVGFWERGERIGLLVIALATGNLATGLWILAVSTQWTVIERLWEARRQLRSPGVAPRPALNRRTGLYAVQAAFWASLAAAFRLPF